MEMKHPTPRAAAEFIIKGTNIFVILETCGKTNSWLLLQEHTYLPQRKCADFKTRVKKFQQEFQKQKYKLNENYQKGKRASRVVYLAYKDISKTTYTKNIYI